MKKPFNSGKVCLSLLCLLVTGSGQAQNFGVPEDLMPTEGAPQQPADTAVPVAGDGAPIPSSAPVPHSLPPDRGPQVPEAVAPNMFAGAPPIAGTRRIMAEGEAPEVYHVEEGDTLYDICDQLIDEPDYWPKLWALNPAIANPHFIYPGMKLRFYAGDSEVPPYLQIITEDDVVPVDKDQLSEADLVAEDISGLLLGFEGDSIVEVVGPDQVDPSAFPGTFSFYGKQFYPASARVMVPAFVYSDGREPLGEVVGGTGGETLVGVGRQVIVEGEGLASGSTYTVLREKESVYGGEDHSYVGIRYDFVAAVSIVKHTGDELYLADVTINRLGAQPGDILVPYQSIYRDVPLGEAGSGGSGNYVVGFENSNREIGGQGSFVLFEKETGAIAAGDTVSVFQSYTRNQGSFVGDLPDVGGTIATVYIIDSSSDVAVGYVTKNDREVRFGDRALKL